MNQHYTSSLMAGALGAVLTVTGISLGFSPAARAGGAVVCVNCSSIIEQLLEEATAIEHLQQSILQTEQQIQMVSMQVKNLQNLPVQLWPNLLPELKRLVSLVGSAQGLNFAVQNTTAAATQQYGKIGSALANPQSSLQQWNADLRDQITKTLQQYQLHENDFQTTQQALEQIEGMEQNAAGQMQLLRAGNEIAKMTLNQIISLQSDVHAVTQTLMNYLGAQASEDLDAKQRYHDWMQQSMQPYTPHF
jgi:P-type conjugative transfer protein TrbJ